MHKYATTFPQLLHVYAYRERERERYKIQKKDNVQSIKNIK